MTLLEKIENLTWWTLDIKLKDILKSLFGVTQSLDTRIVNIENNGENFIPITGTEVGSPITGDLEFESDNITNLKQVNTGVTKQIKFEDDNGLNFRVFDNTTFDGTVLGIETDSFTLSVRDEVNDIESSLQLLLNELILSINSPTSRGIVSNNDFSANITDLDYTQKIYVDRANSYSTNEIKTGGTWIDGKPIYRKVFNGTFPDPIPTTFEVDLSSLNIETCFNSFFHVGGNIGWVNKSMLIRMDLDPSLNKIIITDSDLYSYENSNYNIVLEYTKTID